MNKTIAPELEPILKKMCEIIGVNHETIDFKQEQWFTSHSWTKEQETEFVDWLTHYIYNNKEARLRLSYARKDKASCAQFARLFVLNYGWKVKAARPESGGLHSLRPSPSGV